MADTASASAVLDSSPKKSPVCLIVLGMAGSGKTSLVQRLSTMPEKPYVVNLDPACLQVPYFANIGIHAYNYFCIFDSDICLCRC